MARRLCLRCRSDGLQEYHGTAPKRNSEGGELRTCHVRLSFRDRVTPPNHQLHLIDASYKKNLTLSARAASKTSSCAWLRVEGIGPLLSNLWYVRTHCPSASAHGCRPLFQDCGLPSLSDPIRVIQRSWRPVEDALHAQHVWGCEHGCILPDPVHLKRRLPMVPYSLQLFQRPLCARVRLRTFANHPYQDFLKEWLADLLTPPTSQ